MGALPQLTVLYRRRDITLGISPSSSLPQAWHARFAAARKRMLLPRGTVGVVERSYRHKGGGGVLSFSIQPSARLMARLAGAAPRLFA